MINKTAAPRSNVIHAMRGSFTVCGRRIGDNWQGEYGPAPTGRITCGRCLTGVRPTDHIHPDPDIEARIRIASTLRDKGWRARRADAIGGRSPRYVVMAARELPNGGPHGEPYEYLTASMIPGERTLTNTEYAFTPELADARYRRQLSDSRRTYGA